MFTSATTNFNFDRHLKPRKGVSIALIIKILLFTYNHRMSSRTAIKQDGCDICTAPIRHYHHRYPPVGIRLILGIKPYKLTTLYK